MEKLEMICTKK